MQRLSNTRIEWCDVFRCEVWLIWRVIPYFSYHVLHTTIKTISYRYEFVIVFRGNKFKTKLNHSRYSFVRKWWKTNAEHPDHRTQRNWNVRARHASVWCYNGWWYEVDCRLFLRWATIHTSLWNVHSET